MNIVALDAYALNPGDLSWDGMKELGELTLYDRTSPSLTVERSKEADIILTNKVRFSREQLEQLPRLKYIGVQATGYDIIDINAARELGIIVTNIPAYSTESVAQMVFAHILNIASNVSYYCEQNRNGRWSKSPDFCYWEAPLTELYGKQIGIVGLGNTGSATARIAKAFGMKVAAVTSKDNPEGIEKMDFEQLLKTSDFISLHCPLTDSTREMIDAKALNMMKKEVVLINTGRGPLINNHDVADALAKGTIKAFAADVLDKEPADPSNPLLGAPNCYITPHIAWATVEARTRLMEINIANVKAFIGGEPINVVNK